MRFKHVRLGAELSEDLGRGWAARASELASQLAGASVVTFVLVMMALSFSSAIVGGDELLATQESAFISMSLLSLFTGMIIHVQHSTIPFITAGPYTSLSPLLASVAHGFSTQCAPDAWLPTTIVCFSLLSIFSGLLLYVLAHPRVRLGKAAAYLPAPVLMGMMIAIAVTLLISALQVATGVIVFQTSPLGPLLLRPPPSDPALLRRAGVQSLCAILVGTGLFSTRYFPRSMAILLTPAVLLIAIVGFQAATWLGGMQEEELREHKWLSRRLVLESPADAFASTIEIVRGLAQGRVDWGALFDLRTSPLQALPVYCCVDLLLVVGTLPALMMMPAPQDRKGVDADSELATAGICAMAQGLLGIPAAGYFIGTSMQHRDLRGTRATGWMIVGMCGGCLLLGPLLATRVPRFVLGGLFINFAISYVTSASTIAMTPAEHAVLILTAVTYVGLGAMAGLMVGLIFTCLHFVIEQSYIDAESLVESATELIGASAAGAAARGGAALGDGALAAEAGESARREKEAVSIVLSLKGILFFATTHALTAEILRNVEQRGPASSGSVVLNFARVQSVDVSAIHTLKQLAEELAPRRWVVRCTGLRSRLASRFTKIGLIVVAAGAGGGGKPASAGGGGGGGGGASSPTLRSSTREQPGQQAAAMAAAACSPPRRAAQQHAITPPLDDSPARAACRAGAGAAHTAAPPLPLRCSSERGVLACVRPIAARSASAALDAPVGALGLPLAALGLGAALSGTPHMARYTLCNDSVESLASSVGGGVSGGGGGGGCCCLSGSCESLVTRGIGGAVGSVGAGAAGALSSAGAAGAAGWRASHPGGEHALACTPGGSPTRLAEQLALACLPEDVSSPNGVRSPTGVRPPPPLPASDSFIAPLPTFRHPPLALATAVAEARPLLAPAAGGPERAPSEREAHEQHGAHDAGAVRPDPPPSLVPEDLSQYGALFRAYGRTEHVHAQATILSSNDEAIATELVFLAHGDAIQWRSRTALGGEAKYNESLATLKTSGSLIGGAEVLLAIPRHFEARMLADGEIVRLAIHEMMRIRVERPDVWEVILLKSLQGQTNIVNEALFSVES